MSRPVIDVDPETLNAWRAEIRSELQHSDLKDLVLEAAVNARVGVRVLYQTVLPRLTSLEVRYRVALGVAAVVGPLVGVLGGVAFGG